MKSPIRSHNSCRCPRDLEMKSLHLNRIINIHCLVWLFPFFFPISHSEIEANATRVVSPLHRWYTEQPGLWIKRQRIIIQNSSCLIQMFRVLAVFSHRYYSIVHIIHKNGTTRKMPLTTQTKSGGHLIPPSSLKAASPPEPRACRNLSVATGANKVEVVHVSDEQRSCASSFSAVKTFDWST